MSPSAYPPLQLHVAGRWQADGGAGVREVVNPADGCVLGLLPLASDALVLEAAEAAVRGFKMWRSQSALQRCELLRRAAALMRERAHGMAAVLTLEQGKPVAEALREVSCRPTSSTSRPKRRAGNTAAACRRVCRASSRTR